MSNINRSIKSTKEITLRGINYTLITFDDGEQVLKTFDEKYKLWVTLRFAKEGGKEAVEELIKTVQDVAREIKLNPTTIKKCA